MSNKILSQLQPKDDLARLTLSIRILFCALAAGMLFSWRLWLTERNFPLTPLFNLGENPEIVSRAMLSLILLLAFGLMLFPTKRKFIVALFILFVVEFIGDQNRWQPWVYQYFLMTWLLIFSFKEKPGFTLNTFRLIICGIYFWSGIQKLNPEFFKSTADWLTQPLGNYFDVSFAGLCGKAAKIIPFVEILLAFALLIPRSRKVAMITAIAMHSYIILLMTPLGRNYNYVIVPWNLAMIGFLLLLFRNAKDLSIGSVFKTIKTKYVIPIFILVWIMPVFSLFGKWPSYLSASLYSGNSDNAYIYISKRLKSTLPEELNKYVYTQLDTLYYIYVNEWSIKELKVPTYPEESVFKTARNKFLGYANDSDEVRLLVEKKFTLLDSSHYVYLK